MDIEAQFGKIAGQYVALENDEVLSRYELTVNWPSLVALLPHLPASILDYGVGGGTYARILSDMGYDVLAVDNASEMIEHITGIPARVWTYQDGATIGEFDVVLCKLVVQFVEDLPAFARSMAKVLRKEGTVVISIPHPDKTRPLVDSENIHKSQIGKSGLEVSMMHRELGEIVKAFQPYFALEKTQEPIDPDHPDEPPKRLNLLFRLQ